jgi:hypothetical protein
VTAVDAVATGGRYASSVPAEERGQGSLVAPSAAALGVQGDALVQLLSALKVSSDFSLSSSTARIDGVRGDLKKQLDECLKKIHEAAEQLREAQDSGGGLFGGVFDAIGSVLGEVMGTLLDAGVDFLKSPYEVTKAVVQNFGDTHAMLNALGNCSMDLVQNGSVASDVKGFTEGVVSFCGDLSEYLARLPAEAGLAALKGNNPLEAMKANAQSVWQSLKHNILDNRAFWAVASVLAKGVAVAGALMSGGTLALVAVGLMVALEVEQKTGGLDKLVGEKAAPWVRLGIGIASAVCLGAAGFGTHGGAAVKTMQVTTSLVQSGGVIYQGYRTIQQAQRDAEQIEAQADIFSSMNRMQQLQRVLDRLLGSLKEDSERGTKIEERGVNVVATRAAAQAAQIMPAT